MQSLAERPSAKRPLASATVEPVHATGEILFPPCGFLGKLAAATRAAGVPLVVNEIFTEMGRTGQLFAFETEGVIPDAILLGNNLGGFPGGLLAEREALMSAWPRGAQASTFQLHAITSAAGAAALRFALDQDFCAQAREFGARIDS